MGAVRKFLYMVVNHHRRPQCHAAYYGELQKKACVYSVHRIDPSTLFHREDQAELAAAPPVKARLRRCITTFDHPTWGFNARTMDFMLFGRGRDKILAVPRSKSRDHKPILYDDASQTSRELPAMRFIKFRPLWLAIHDDLYVLEKALPTHTWWETDNPLSSDYSVEALLQVGDSLDWAWHLLPPPPYVPPHHDLSEVPDTAAVVGDSHIWVSGKDQGTFSLDTEARTWSKVAEWELPFQGQVQYAPEHALWYGFSSRDEGVLCAADLGCLISMGQQSLLPPPACYELDMCIMGPKGERPIQGYSSLVHLGGGRFCVTNYYSNVVILIGMEVERCGEILRLIKHKSCHYYLGEDYFECIL
ncbi:hypothetical protein VPH35_056220 [Triticum aestivum]